MKVLYVSKALVVPAYQDKLRALSDHVAVSAVIPERWGADRTVLTHAGAARLQTAKARFHGHNHFHLYANADALIAQHAPDIVHIDEEPYSAVTFQLTRMCRRRGIPTLFFAWQNLDKRLPPPFGALRKWVFRNSSGAIAGSQQAAAVLCARGYRGSIAVIPQFGVDAERFAPNAETRAIKRALIGASGGSLVAGFGGRLVPEKGVYLLVEAIARDPRWRLLLMGDGPERGNLERAAAAAGVADRVFFAGPVSSLQIQEWLVACDALVLPSLSTRGWVEQFGRILVEAMACGVPVVGSSSGEIPHVIGENSGIITPEGDVAALGNALARLESPDVRATLGTSARARVLENYTNEKIAADTVAYYRTLLPAGARA